MRQRVGANDHDSQASDSEEDSKTLLNHAVKNQQSKRLQRKLESLLWVTFAIGLGYVTGFPNAFLRLAEGCVFAI